MTTDPSPDQPIEKGAELPTPETDAMELVLYSDDSSTLAQTIEIACNFARSLERRLAAALSERDEALSKLYVTETKLESANEILSVYGREIE